MNPLLECPSKCRSLIVYARDYKHRASIFALTHFIHNFLLANWGESIGADSFADIQIHSVKIMRQKPRRSERPRMSDDTLSPVFVSSFVNNPRQ
jgi:hypothetical protein